MGRWGHTATLLPNGKVLVAGGSGADNGAELYDPATATWSATAPMMSPRYGHTATLLPNGRVLVAGGFDVATGFKSSAELYDPATASWTRSGSMSIPRYGHSATLLTNGQVLIAGGGTTPGDFNITASAELYDPGSGTWRLTGAMHATRYQHPATLLANGTVLINGGNSTNSNTYLASAELYDPVTGAWRFTGSMATERGGLTTATLLRSGKVLVVAGSGNSGYIRNAEIYDPGTGTWAPTLPLHKERGGHTATVLPDGKVLIVGGGDNQNRSVAICELYDLGVQTNTPPTLACPQMLTGECGAPVTVSVQVGDADGDPLTLVWLVNGVPAQTNTVPAGASVNLTNLDLSVPGLPLGTNIVAIGVTDGTNVASCTTAVTIVDTVPPVFSSAVAAPNVLWPPNHEMVRVNVRASVSESCGPATWEIIGVRCDEPMNGRGDGNTSPDWKITSNHTLLLRAERSGKGDARIYSITVQATDGSGNKSQEQTVTVTVPKNQGKSKR